MSSNRVQTDGYPEEEDTMVSAMLGLFVYSTLMFTLPIGAFFGAKQILVDHFELEAPFNQIGAAIASILVVNLIIFAYIRKAFREERKSSNQGAKKTN